MYSHLPSIEHTVDAQGFVLVDGARVPNRPGHPLRSATATCTCQLCGGRIPLPLRLVREFEAAIDAVRYFHAPVAGVPSLCEKCRER